jgi:uncharacterized protein YndB with AHSA1/START domain
VAEPITVKATINAPVEKVWEYYNSPEHVTKWNNASPDWHTPKAENDLRVGGSFVYRMEPKVQPEGLKEGDERAGFDFGGTYEEVIEKSLMKYVMGDGRAVTVKMNEVEGKTDVSVTFDPENENAPEFQKEGWQGILDNFKNYVEAH